MPTTTFMPKTENRQQATTVHMTKRRREDEHIREPLTKFRSCVLRSATEEEADMSRTATLERCEVESEKEGTNFKIPANVEKTDLKDEGVAEKLNRLKEELLAELKSQTGAHTSLRTSSPFMARIQEETIPQKFQMQTIGAYNSIGNPRDHVINYKTFIEL